MNKPNEVVIDGVRYVPVRWNKLGVFQGKDVYDNSILWDKTKEHWNIQVWGIDVDAGEFIGADGRRLKFFNARW